MVEFNGCFVLMLQWYELVVVNAIVVGSIYIWGMDYLFFFFGGAVKDKVWW